MQSSPSSCPDQHSAARHRTVGIVGAGAIGCFLGTILSQDKSLAVQFFGREYLAASVQQGISAEFDGHRCNASNIALYTSLINLLECDLVLLTVKATALANLIPQLKKHLRPDVPIIALQNGIGVVEMLQAQLPNPLYRAIVPFNVVKKTSTLYAKASGGALLWPADSDHRLDYLANGMRAQGLAVTQVANMQQAEYGKLLLNLNNALNAISGLPLKQQLLNADLRQVLAAAMTEWLQICAAQQIKPLPFTPLPATWLPKLLKLPTALFRIIARSMLQIEPFARSSMWDDLQAGRRTEVMYLNGAVANLGVALKIATPVNAAIVELVKHLENGEQLAMTPADLKHHLLNAI